MAAQFELTTAADPTTILATVLATSPFTIDLEALGFGAGTQALSLFYRDQYGTRSLATNFSVSVDGSGNIMPGIPVNVSAEAIAGGYIRLRWEVLLSAGGLVDIASFEISEAAAPSTILATVLFDLDNGHSRNANSKVVGPFTNGASKTLRVRSKSSANVLTAWVAAAAVTADSVGPGPAVIVEP